MYTQLTMEIEILEQEENPLLHRTEVKFEIKHDEETPSRLSVRDSLAAKLDKDSEEVVVHNLNTKFGMRQTVGRSKVYDSPRRPPRSNTSTCSSATRSARTPTAKRRRPNNAPR